MGKERCPFKSGSAVGPGTADQFMPAAGKFHQLGFSELADDLPALTLRKEMFQFHTPPL